MDWVLFYLYAGICLAMMAPGIWQKDYRLQFPVLAGGAVLLMVCLPLAGLIADYDGPSNPAIRRFILMAILCQLASWAGYRYAEKFKVSSNHKFDPGRLAISSVALSVFGFFFAYQLSATDIEIAENGNWTGIATIFSTLSLVSRYGFERERRVMDDLGGEIGRASCRERV